MALRTPAQKKLLIEDPNALVARVGDGEEIDNADTGGLTRRTFVLGESDAPVKQPAPTTALDSGAATAAAILAKSRAVEDDLLPIGPLAPLEPTSEDEDDLLALVATEADIETDTEEPAAEQSTGAPASPRKRTRRVVEVPDLPDLSISAEASYKFPYGKAVMDILPDLPGTFCIRIAYNRGKAVLPVFKSTPLRSLAEIRCRGQQYPVFLMQHARRKRDRVLLGAKRKTASSWRSAVRCAAVVSGKSDRLTWFWRVTATAHALQQPVVAGSESRSPEAIRLMLPFAPGKIQTFNLPGAEGRGLVILLNDVAVSVVAQPQDGVLPTISSDHQGVYLHLENAELAGNGTALAWETWMAYAKTESEAVGALAFHLADVADRSQVSQGDTHPFLRRMMETAERELMRNDIIEKRGADKNSFRAEPHHSDLLIVGPGADAALTAVAILNRFFTHGEELVHRRARLLANGICEFQNSNENSPHWGAIWDALVDRTKWGDEDGRQTVSFLTTARTAKGLQLLQNHFDVEMYERTALAAAQWILLRLERDGLPQGERFGPDGKPIGDVNPWIAGEALIPLVATFRATKNEVYFKTALRTVETLEAMVTSARLTFDTASTEQLAALIEGVLLVSREYERPEMVTFAKSMGQVLRARRLPDGCVSDPTGMAQPMQPELPLLASTLSGARAALALSRVDDDVLWPIFALRALRAVDKMLRGFGNAYLNVADRGNVLTQAYGVLLGVAARAKGSVADRDKLTITRAWQTFGPDPATNEYVKVSMPNGDSPDYLALVCPVSQQVLVAVLAPPQTATVEIVKNGRRPYMKNLLNGDYDQTATLVPFGDGTEASIGVFLADT